MDFKKSLFLLLFFYNSTHTMNSTHSSPRTSFDLTNNPTTRPEQNLPQEYDHHQSILRKNVVAYLTKEALTEFQKTNDIARYKTRLAFIRAIEKTSGFCTGLSGLWAYGKRISDKKYPKSETYDDIHFFNRMYKMLATWNRTSDFTRTEKQDIERFLSHILLFHIIKDEEGDYIISPPDKLFLQDPTLLYETTAKTKPQENFQQSESVILSKKILIDWLEQVIQPGHMILVHLDRSEEGVEGHSVALFQSKSGTFYYYDSSNKLGEFKTNNLEEIVQKITDFSVKNNCFYTTIQTFTFPGDTPYTGPIFSTIKIKTPDIVDLIYTQRDYLTSTDDIMCNFFEYHTIPLEQYLEIITSEHLSEKVKANFINNVCPTRIFKNIIATGNIDALELFAQRGLKIPTGAYKDATTEDMKEEIKRIKLKYNC